MVWSPAGVSPRLRVLAALEEDLSSVSSTTRQLSFIHIVAPGLEHLIPSSVPQDQACTWYKTVMYLKKR